MIGFMASAPGRVRHPIYRGQARGKLGYVEHVEGRVYFCDAAGRRVARVLRYKPEYVPAASVCLSGSTIDVPSIDELL
jgi:hypothetical protein